MRKKIAGDENPAAQDGANANWCSIRARAISREKYEKTNWFGLSQAVPATPAALPFLWADCYPAARRGRA